jgi:tetratricopeptide (TPR) repeat protein
MPLRNNVSDLADIPRERMYKSRLHSWGLDKKKKEHEMLEVIRIGFKQPDMDKDLVFRIRGRPVTLGDALHYFSRKGIKDPQALLDASPEPSSPSDAECQTPVDVQSRQLTSIDETEDPMIEEIIIDIKDLVHGMATLRTVSTALTTSNHAQNRLRALQETIWSTGGQSVVPPNILAFEPGIPPELTLPREYRYMEAMLCQTRYHFSQIFMSRKLSVNSSTWSATSDDGLSDKFYFGMYRGYSFLWNGQSDLAFRNFEQAFGLIRSLLTEQHVGFLIYIYDLIIRYEGSGQQVLLLRLLRFLSEMARTVFSETHPVCLIASWMVEASDIRSALAEFTLRRLLDFFQDSIGYFHQETMALLQTFAWALMNREHYMEAAARFKQLANAFDTTYGVHCYESCYAIRSMAEAYFHQGHYASSLEAVDQALQRSTGLPHLQEREIHVRCLRQMAEISLKLGRIEEAEATMQQCVDCTKETFGENHPFSLRAEMHQKSLKQEGLPEKSAIPLMVHRLGKGGNAAMYIWASRERNHVLGN